MGVVLPSLGLSLQRGCHSGGGEGIMCRSLKKSVRKILRGFSHEIILNRCEKMEYLILIIICDERRRPRRDAPAADQYL
jgi:hypothetical protein